MGGIGWRWRRERMDRGVDRLPLCYVTVRGGAVKRGDDVRRICLHRRASSISPVARAMTHRPKKNGSPPRTRVPYETTIWLCRVNGGFELIIYGVMLSPGCPSREIYKQVPVLQACSLPFSRHEDASNHYVHSTISIGHTLRICLAILRYRPKYQL
jgi:hypothetical protein